jgi:hypothetical protein
MNRTATIATATLSQLDAVFQAIAQLDAADTDTTRWTCCGDVRGACSIRHRTKAAAAACCDADNRAVKRWHGPRAYSDRTVIRAR